MNASLTTTLPTAVPPSRASEKRVCRHCGSASPAGEFCCAGCAYVYRLIHAQGFDAYYQLKDPVTPPADPSLLAPRDYAWLETAQRDAEAAALATGAATPPSRSDRQNATRASRPQQTRPQHTPSLLLSVQGISCAGCVWLIEKLFAQQPGAGRLEVNAQTGQMRLRWVRGAFDVVAFARGLQSFNYFVGPAGAEPEVAESGRLARRIGLSTAFAMNVMLFTLPVYFGMEPTFAYAGLFGLLAFVFATLSLLTGGMYFLGRAVRALRDGVIHLDLPIGLGIVSAYAGSVYGWLSGRAEFVYFDFVSAFILLMLVGRWAQTVAVENNQRRLLRQQPVAPRVRLLAADGNASEVAPEQLRAGQRFVVAPGGVVPVGAKLESAATPLNLAWINGEAEPRIFRAGQHVAAGAQNVGRTDAVLAATEDWEQSLLAELLRPAVREDFRHRLIERVIQGYLVAILGTAALAGLGWLWATGDVPRAGAVITAILVVSCPCALGLAFPLADEIATVALRKRGVFVRAADLWPRLSRVRQVVFDKTGTLTLETPVLHAPEKLAALDPTARAVLLALVQDSAHPVSRCLHENLLASSQVPPLPIAVPVTECIGDGVELNLGAHRWRLGRAGWAIFSEHGPSSAADDSAVTLTHDGVVVAQFHLTDTARPGAREELAALRQRGLETVILSGDQTEKVHFLADELGVPSVCALGGQSPHAKARWLDANGADHSLMLGDGANDSLAFDRALCRGTPAVHRGMLTQKADFYYLGRGLDGIRALFEINTTRRRTQTALLVFMIAYNLLAVGLAASGHMNPLLAAVLMPLSSLATLAIVGLGMKRVWRRGVAV